MVDSLEWEEEEEWVEEGREVEWGPLYIRAVGVRALSGRFTERVDDRSEVRGSMRL